MSAEDAHPLDGLPSRRQRRAAQAAQAARAEQGSRSVQAAQATEVALPVLSVQLPDALREELLRPIGMPTLTRPPEVHVVRQADLAPARTRRPRGEDPRTGALRLASRTAAGSTGTHRRILSVPPVSFDAELEPEPSPPEPARPSAGAPAAPAALPFAAEAVPPGEETVVLPRAGAEPLSRRSRRAGAGSTRTDPAPPARAARPARPARSGRSGRSGRNLPAAIGVGLVLGGAVLGSLLIRKEAFVGLVSAAVVLAVWELAGALSAKRIQIPVIPLVVGALGMLVSAYVAREEGLLVAFTLTAFGVLLWRIIDGIEGAARDIAAGVFTAAYVPFLAGFAILMLPVQDGAMRVIVFISVTVASDIGGYAVGVRFGRHPMAPSVSPKKSWEGFAGSALACMVVASLGVVLLLDGPWWAGPAIGAAAAVTATLGDLSESLLKRDLGVKDMGSVLPGHGGMMDRLDSLLLTAPAVFLLLAYLVPTR
jgi:phosphatidate cytidylyltransferase